MMKKELLNKKVVRAISLGLSAVMLTTPMTAMAAEGDDTTTPEPIKDEVGTENGVCDDAQAAADKVDSALVTVADAETVVVSDINNNVEEGEIKDSEGNALTNGDGVDLAKAVINEANDEANDETEVTPDVDADTAIDNVNTQLDVAEANDKLVQSQVKSADVAVNTAEGAANAADSVVNSAQTVVDEQLDNIKNATTVEDANAAYETMESAVEQAQKDFNAKLADYNAAKNAYNAAETKAAEYKAAYDEAVNNADANAAAAAEALAAAQKEADELYETVNAAKNAVGEASKAAMDIAEKEKLTQDDDGRIWTNEDELFISIMENYYLPEILAIEGATVERIQGKDNNEYNYFTATYTDENGQQQVKYFNYKMDVGDDNKKNSHKDNIVIFEKREVEVNWAKASVDNPDYYLDEEHKKISPKELEEGLNSGKYIAIVKDGKTTYYEANDATDSETLIEDSEITTTSTTDVIVDENSATETFKIDNDGNLVKEVSADVTTITYTGKTFVSEEEYATDAERDAAAATKEAELEKATGKDATVTGTETTTTTYVATGTYIPTFTDKIIVSNEEVEKGWTVWDEADSESQAVDYVYDKKLEKYDNEDEYYIISRSNDLYVSGYTEEETGLFGITTDDSDYLVSGSASVTYAKVTKTTVDKDSFGAMWDDIKSLFGFGDSANEKLTKAAKEVIEAAGGIFISAEWADWSWNEATIRYVEGVAVTGKCENDSAKAAEDATKDAALTQAKATGADGVYNVSADVKEKSVTTYSYKVDYLEGTSNTENKVVSTETYADVEVLTGEITQNLNYINNVILLTQNDLKYREFVDSAKNLTEKYERLLTEAEAAQKAVEAAQDDVDTLQAEIDALKNAGADLGDLSTLLSRLEDAKDILDTADEKLNGDGGLNDQLEDAKDVLDGVVDALTPDPVVGGGMGDVDDSGDADDSSDTTTVPASNVTPVEEEGTPAVVTVTAAAGNGTGAGQQAVVIEDEATPLAGGIGDGEDEEVIVAETVEDEQTIVAIEDEETPLAPSAEERAKMSWWWLLIIALLGATGYKMYKEHQKKKEEALDA